MTVHKNADLLARAETAVLEAVQEYQRVLVKNPVHRSTAISYTPSKTLIDDRQYRIESGDTLAPYSKDEILDQAAQSNTPAMQAALLAFSPHWEDRIRAAALNRTLRNEVAMPNGFPCIYEPADSPKNERALHPQPFVWVASPDEVMLHELLPLYRELWASYEAQRPHSPSRTFQVGRLDGVLPGSIYRPDTTPAQVIGQTMLTHSDMYRTAPAHLKKMHPLHKAWADAR